MDPRRKACAAAARTSAGTLLVRRQLLSSTRPPRPCCAATLMDHRRRFTTSPPLSSTRLPVPKNVAVIGGGLTGLVTAHYLSILLPASSRITIYEGTERTGGWIDSVSHTGDPGDVLEGGARMVAPQSGPRYDDMVMYELIDQLNLKSELRVSPKSAQLNQYIYYPDHLVNVAFQKTLPRLKDVQKMVEGDVEQTGGPSLLTRYVYLRNLLQWAIQSGTNLLTEPIFKGFLLAPWKYFTATTEEVELREERLQKLIRAPGNFPPPSMDESVGDYITRSLGGDPTIAENVMSAMMHGIYGGDVWKISVASSILRPLWLRNEVFPLFKLFHRQAKIAELRQQQAEKMGRMFPEDHDDFPGQNDGMGGGIAGYPPLTRDTFVLGTKFGDFKDKGGVHVAMLSEIKLFNHYYSHLRTRHPESMKDNGPTHSESASQPRPYDTLGMLKVRSAEWGLFGFAKGFGTLTDALARRLRSQNNVVIRSDEPVTALKYDANMKKVRIVTSKSAPNGDAYDRVISTVSSPALFRMAGGSETSGGQLPSLRDAHAVTIQVVNLHYAESGLHRPYNGFGYLIPQTVPLQENPEAALGVMFDSDREDVMRPLHEHELDPVPIAGPKPTTLEPDSRNTGSKYTVMLGGHYWDNYRYPDDFPTAEEAVEMAESVLQRHLRDTPGWGGPEKQKPIATRTKLCRECIPQHYVGHAKRMADTDFDLRRAFGGRLAVAGGSFTATGPGVLPSVRSAYDIALRVAGRGYKRPLAAEPQNTQKPAEWDMDFVGDTGLGRFADPATDSVHPFPKDYNAL